MKRIAALILWLASAGLAYAAPAPVTVPTIAALQAGNFSSYATVQVLGYRSVGDGGGGFFNWFPASVAAEDSCTIFKTGGLTNGRFVRQIGTANISVEMCGAYHDGTNAAATLAAFQAANDYVAASASPNAIIEFKGPEYQFGTGGGVTKAASNSCPRWIGGGIGTTSLRLQPSTETAAFTFTGGSGAICRGAVNGVRIVGNSNAVGVKFLGQNGMDFDFEFYSGKMAVLFCNCSTAMFTEQNVGKVYIQNMANGVTNLAEYRISGGGSSSFRGSGFAPGTQVSKSSAAANPLILIGASAQVYNAPLSIKFTNTGGGLTSIVKNNSSNIASFVSGEMDLESDPSDEIALADTTGQLISYGGTVFALGITTGSGLLPNKAVLTRLYGIGGGGVPGYANADGLRTQLSFTGTSGVTLAPPVVTNFSVYQVTITATGYIWSGSVLVGTDTSAGGTCATPTTVGGILYDNTAGYGAPTVACASNAPRFTNGSWPASSMVITYSVHAQ